MRVLFVTSTYPTRHRPSAGIFVRNQFQQLRRRASEEDRYDLLAVYTRKRSDRRSVFKVIMACFRLLPYLLRRYDVIHVHFVSPLLFVAPLYQWLHPRARLIVSVHGNGLRRLAMAKPASRERYGRALRRADRIIAAGPALRAPIRALAGIEPHEVLCAGVDVQKFFHERGTTKLYDFIYVGSFNEQKGLDILLEALRLAGNPDMRAAFVGNGPLAADLQRAGHNLHIDVFHDVPQTRLRRLYNQSRFLVFPSAGDGFGLVVSESLFCATPPIVFAGGGAQCQVEHMRNGLVYKPNTPARLVRVLKDAWQMDEENYAPLAAQAAQSSRSCALAMTVDRLIEIYRNGDDKPPA